MKGKRFYTYTTKVVVFLALLGLSVCVAQTPSPGQEISEQALLEQVEAARKSGVQISNETVEEMLRSHRTRARVMQEMREELSGQGSPAASTTPGVTVKLLSKIVGKEGIPFPKAEESVWKPIPTPDPALADPTPTPLPTATPYQKPRACDRNETKQVVYEPSVTEGGILNDILFISEELVPLEPEAVFGSRVSLVPYSYKLERGEAPFTRMEIYSVPCLPYRIRLTNKAHYYDFGLNAYRNYDKAPSGRGILDPVMAGRLAPAGTRPRSRR